MKKKAKPFLKKERQKTDASLVVERNRINKLNIKSRLIKELETDKAIQKDRLQADKKTSLARGKADLKHKIKSKTAKVNPNQKKSARNKKRLIDERNQADTAIDLERSQMDTAMNLERISVDELAIKLLAKERELTDKSLLFERNETDSKIDEASKLLSDEIIDHLQTKISLTTRDEFLAIVSHDLKNPIGFASSCTQMLLDNPNYKKMDPEVRSWLGYIKENLETSLRLIRDLLDMERIAEGKLHLQIGRYNIGEILRNSVKNFHYSALSKGISLTVMPSDISGDIFCDQDRIMQVLFNLIDNALKFTPKGGSINLTATLMDDEVEVTISDTGPGIPKEKLKHIFDRFAQLVVHDREGLGLGLYITKMLVEAHKGQLRVKSKVGSGTTFSFSLPRRLISGSSTQEKLNK